MNSYKLIEKYCNDVCNQIRWKKAKPAVSLELENHICDQRDAYMFQGDDEICATKKAVEQMGDPIFLGEELDKTHRPKEQWLLMGFIFMIMGLSVNILVNEMDYSTIFSYIVASILVVVCYYIDFTILRKHPMGIYFIVLAISFILIIFSSNVNGRMALIFDHGIVFLTDIFIVFPLVFMLVVYSMKGKGYLGILQCGLYNIPLAGIMLYEPSLYYLLFHLIVSLVVLCFGINNDWFEVNKKNALMLVLIPSVIVFLITCYNFIYSNNFRIQSIKAYINPYEDRTGLGYFNYTIRTLMSEAAIVGQGVFPKELGEVSNLLYIGKVFPLVLLTYKFGLICLFFIIVFFLVFSLLGIKKALKEKSMLGSLICITILSIFIGQSLTYILSNIGYGLASYVVYNFIFSSGVALYINSILLGFMLSVFRTGEAVATNL